MASDALAMARQLARRISTSSPDTPLNTSKITRLSEQIATSEQLAVILAALLDDASKRLDTSPREALGLARVAHELTNARADEHTRAQTALTLATVLNRLGEFRETLTLTRVAAKEFEKSGEMQAAAQCFCQAAWAQTFLGHLKDALADAERARQMDASDLMKARGDWIQARVLRDQGNYPEAEKLFEQSRTTFASVAMPLDAARCTRERAHTCLLGERAASVSLLQSARQTFEPAQCIFDVAVCDFLSGVDLLLKTCYPDAQKLISQARDNFVRLGAAFFAAWSDAQLGIIHHFQNRFEESLDASHRARDYFLAHDVPVEVSACDINLGITYYALNRYDEALTCYQEAADIAVKEGREARAGRIFNNMGETYGAQGLYAKALDLHQRALEIYSEKGLTSLMGSALVNLAIACRQLGQYGQAIGNLQRAREIFLTKDFTIRLAECEFNLGEVHFALHEASAANIHLQRARNIYAEHRLASLVAGCDRRLAYLAAENGERERALALLAESRATFLKHHQIVDAALCDLAEGELALDWNENEPARVALLRSRSILSPGFPDFAWRIAYGLGRCAWAVGDREAALDHYLDAVHTIAKSRSVLVTEQLSNDYFASRQSVFDVGLDAALRLHADESALAVIEASKARMFLTLLQNREWKSREDQGDKHLAGLQAREKQLRYELERLRARAAVQMAIEVREVWRGDVQIQISAAELQELNSVSQAYEAVVTQLRLASGGLAGVSSPAPFALEQFRASANTSFGTDWAALDYYLSGDDLTVAMVRPDRIKLAQKKLSPYDRAVLGNCVTTDHELRELIYRGTLRGEPASSIGARYLRRLHEILIPEGLDVGTLLISPHSSLHALPFHALIAPNGDGYLIEQHAVVYTPSLQALQLLLSTESSTAPTQPLVLGLSHCQERMPALSFASDEVEAIRGVFDGRVQVFWGDQATRQKLFDLNASNELQQYDVLHFATHAVLDRAAPHQSRVLLHDHALTTLDILDLTLNARVVTLSACQTALGQGGRGDELVGLARAFFYAGTRALLATLWSVEDQSMAELTERVYGHLTSGENIAVALQRVQIEMIREGRRPYQWAPLVLMGRP